MDILTVWGFRMVRANRSRTITVILAVVGFFALLTSSIFVPDGLARAVVDGGFEFGLYRNITLFVCRLVYLVIFFMLFSCFSVTVDECRRDASILTSVGATAKQIRGSLLLRALALDLSSAAIGIPLGLAVSRLALGADAFRSELIWFFWLRITVVFLSCGLLIVPCAMLLAVWCSRVRRRRRRRPSKRHLFRSTFSRRVFGAGGDLGRLSSRKSFRYRVIFTLSFSVCLAAAAMLVNEMQLLAQAQMTAEEDVALELYCTHGSPVKKKLDALLQTCRADGLIEDCSVVQTLSFRDGYCILDNAWLTDDALRLQSARTHLFDQTDDTLNFYRHCRPVVQDGKSVQLFQFKYICILDDASFDRFAQANGIDAGTDGTLLFDSGWIGKTTTPLLKNNGTERDVTLHFLPDTFEAALPDPMKKSGRSFPADAFDYADYLHAANAASLRTTVRLAGAASEDPIFGPGHAPMWVVPERMADPFMDIAQQAALVRHMTVDVKIQTQAHQEVCDLFSDAWRDEPDLYLERANFGMGNTVLHEPEQWHDSLCVQDNHTLLEDATALQANVPLLQTFLLLFMASILLIGILNTAHMNRLTRRREKAILDSIGMDKRQKTGMLLYESARYALFSALCGLFCMIWIYSRPFYNTLRALSAAYLDVRNYSTTRIALINGSKKLLWETFFLECTHMWWVFIAGAAMIFALLIVTDRIIERRSKREELIRILKDDANIQV